MEPLLAGRQQLVQEELDVAGFWHEAVASEKGEELHHDVEEHQWVLSVGWCLLWEGPPLLSLPLFEPKLGLADQRRGYQEVEKKMRPSPAQQGVAA